jgi:hypothetical protein
MAESSASAARAVTWLVSGIVLLSAAFGVVAYRLNSTSLQIDALRFLAIALVGILVVRGVRWARLLLLALTGLAAAFAVLTAASVSMAPLWKVVFFIYGGGTIACLWGLFVRPAATYFATAPAVPKGGA